MAMKNHPTSQPGASAEGVGRGQRARVLFGFNDLTEKKIFYMNKIFISVFYIIKLVARQKQQTIITHALPPGHMSSLYSFSALKPVLVGCCVPSLFSGCLRLFFISIHFIFVSPIAAPNDRAAHPQAFLTSLSSSVTSLSLPLMPSFCWLLYLPINRQPPKANASIFSLFFDGVYVCAPNKGTDNDKCKPATKQLA